jgi:hypothetical protein
VPTSLGKVSDNAPRSCCIDTHQIPYSRPKDKEVLMLWAYLVKDPMLLWAYLVMLCAIGQALIKNAGTERQNKMLMGNCD